MQNREVKPVPLHKLMVDPQVQRSLDRRRAAKIGVEFNPDAVGIVTVSQRANGDYFIIDGQHRVEGMRIAGLSDDKAECEVFTGLTLADEAAMFRLRNNTAHPQYIDKFRVRVIEGDPVAVAIDDMVHRHGWKIQMGNSVGDLAAVQALERIYRLEATAAERALSTLTRAWGLDSSSVDGRLLDGMGLVFIRYGDAIEVDDLIARLARFSGGAGALIGKARGLRDLVGSTIGRAVAEIVVELYNQRRRTKALPPWRTA